MADPDVDNRILLPTLNRTIKNCPLCGSRYFGHFFRIPYLQAYVQYLICKNCGLVFQSPQMDEISQQIFYEENYRLFAFGQSGPPQIDLTIQKKRANHLVYLLKPHTEQIYGKNHIDIGSGLGILLQEIHDTYNMNSIGIEPDKVYREYSVSHSNLPVFSDFAELKKTFLNTASLITISHVLEHLPDPIEYLVYLREKIIAENGLLLIEVPNLYFHFSFDLAHSYAFSPHTIKEVLRKSGYRIISHKNHGIPMRITPRYITVIAKPEKLDVSDQYNVIPESRNVIFWRSLGMSVSQIEDSVFRMIRKIKRAISLQRK